MASKGAIGARAGLARDRLQAAMVRLSERESVDLPPGNSFPYRQPELKVAADTERAAAFLEKVLGDDPVEYHVNEEPASPDQVTEGRNAPQVPAAEDDGRGGTDDEPTFHGHPLSAFDGLSDEAVLQMDGVGPATLKSVRKAQKKRDRAAARQQAE